MARWTRFKSTCVRSGKYNSESRTLDLKFDSGVYTYRGVPDTVWKGLRKSKSKGKFYNKWIRGFYK